MCRISSHTFVDVQGACLCLWVSYIFGSNGDFEERKSSIEILTKVVVESFYKTYGFRMSIGRGSFSKGFKGRLVKVFS
jgi:hypothetical protein